MKRAWGMIVVSLCMVFTAAHAADDPQTGHWKIDLARSKYVSAPPPQISEVAITSYGKDGVSIDVNSVNAKGEKMVIQYSAEYDGKPYPRTEIGPGAIAGQTVTLKRIDAQTVERIVYLDGKPVGTERWVISKDGKTRTVTQSGIDAHGKPINILQIYVKQ